MAGLDWSSLILDLINGKQPAAQTAKAGINAHNLMLDLSWLFEGLVTRSDGFARFPKRIMQFLSPGWKIHSRGDFQGLGEYGTTAALTTNVILASLKSFATGTSASHLLFEHANYDPPPPPSIAHNVPRHLENARLDL